MANRYLSVLKTVVVGVVVGAGANMLTNMGNYFGDKVIHTVDNTLDALEEVLDDGKGHKVTYQVFQTANMLLEDLLDGDPAAEKVTRVVNQVFSFAKEEGIPCDCIPLLAAFLLQDLDISIVVDDSTSMGSGVGSRWEECRKLASMVAKYGMISDGSTVSLKFLNQEENTKITSPGIIDDLFARKPSGATPLIAVLENTIFEIKKQDKKRRQLVYVFTDGVPSDGAHFQPTLTWVRQNFAPDREISDNVAINFIVADTNPSTEKEYKRADDFVPADGQMLHIDTNLSYKSEQARCADGLLTEGLYKVKILVGAINEEFGDLDQVEGGDLMTKSQELRALKGSWDTLRELNADLIIKQKKEH